MLLAVEEIIEFTRGCTREDLSTNRMLTLAVLKSLDVIGEAASRITPAGRARWPDVPWKAIIGMQNTLIHVHFDINLDNVWETVVSDIPRCAGLSGSTCRRISSTRTPDYRNHP